MMQRSTSHDEAVTAPELTTPAHELEGKVHDAGAWGGGCVVAAGARGVTSIINLYEIIVLLSFEFAESEGAIECKRIRCRDIEDEGARHVVQVINARQVNRAANHHWSGVWDVVGSNDTTPGRGGLRCDIVNESQSSCCKEACQNYLPHFFVA